MNWFKIKEVQLVWAPIGTYTNKKGEEKTKFLKIGVKIAMEDGTHWFHSYKHGSWTKHHLPVRKMDRLGRPMVEGGQPAFLPPHKERYNEAQLQREWGRRRPELVLALQNAVANAEEEGSDTT
jgi:hypothetical protein